MTNYRKSPSAWRKLIGSYYAKKVYKKSQHKRVMFHHLNGPAYIKRESDFHSLSFKEYFLNNRLHRIDGPAVSRKTSTPPLYFICDVEYTESDYVRILKVENPSELRS